jgi:transcriptional regulator with XRE-family HTH domain
MDGIEAGKRVRAARAYAGMSREALGEAIGRSVPTVQRIEEGDRGSLKTGEERRQLLERVQVATGCPPEMLGLSEPASSELRVELDDLRRMQERVLQRQQAGGAALAEVQLALANLQRRLETTERRLEANGRH